MRCLMETVLSRAGVIEGRVHHTRLMSANMRVIAERVVRPNRGFERGVVANGIRSASTTQTGKMMVGSDARQVIPVAVCQSADATGCVMSARQVWVVSIPVENTL